jgi:pimeloyl-ACP methyl ester carboxylesterase
MSRHAIYLHGFASSPRSTKATWFVRRASEAGWLATAPDLNLPEFETLTISRMIEQVGAAITALPEGPVALAGSSLGGMVALHAAVAGRESPDAARHPIEKLVFLAPAFDLIGSLEAEFGPAALDEWRRTDSLEVFHYAEQCTRRLRWGFFEDARRYDAFAVDPGVPTLVYQGRRDQAVDARMVERWADTRPSVTLRVLDDDHQMLASLEPMWDGIREFLGAAGSGACR